MSGFRLLLETEDDGVLHRCLESEKGSLTNDRCSVTITRGDGALIFELVSKDSTALRATLTSINNLITVYEKMKNDGTDERN